MERLGLFLDDHPGATTRPLPQRADQGQREGRIKKEELRGATRAERAIKKEPGYRMCDGTEVRVKKSRMEANLFSGCGRGSYEFFDGGKDLRELLIIFLLKGFDFASEIAIRIHEPAQLHE